LIGKRTLLGAAVLLTAWVGLAEEQTFRVDPGETRVSFTLGATMHTVRGTLGVVSGEIRFDLDGGAAAGEIVLDAGSAETGNSKRDKKMHTKVLESERYPTIVFTAERIEGELGDVGAGWIALHGRISIHGAEHSLILEAEVERDGDRISGDFTFTAPYVAWEIKDPSTFILRVAKEVEVIVEVRGNLQ